VYPAAVGGIVDDMTAVLVSPLVERLRMLAASFPHSCDALGVDVQIELDHYIEQYPDPVRPFRNEAQLFALHLLHRFALQENCEAMTDAVNNDICAMRRRA
jgi:hypothetical protein